MEVIICVCVFCWKVFDGWILKGETFPSSQDHPLPTTERYIDFCESGHSRRSIRSSQNVAMIFFRVHEPGNGFTVTIRTEPNLFRKWTDSLSFQAGGRTCGRGEGCQICFSKVVVPLPRFKKFEVRNDLNKNSFVIRNDLRDIFSLLLQKSNHSF